MSAVWFMKEDTKEDVFGPVTADELQKLVRIGWVSPETWLRKGLTGEWYKARRIKGLFTNEANRKSQTNKMHEVDIQECIYNFDPPPVRNANNEPKINPRTERRENINKSISNGSLVFLGIFICYIIVWIIIISKSVQITRYERNRGFGNVNVTNHPQLFSEEFLVFAFWFWAIIGIILIIVYFKGCANRCQICLALWSKKEVNRTLLSTSQSVATRSQTNPIMNMQGQMEGFVVSSQQVPVTNYYYEVTYCCQCCGHQSKVQVTKQI